MIVRARKVTRRARSSTGRARRSRAAGDRSWASEQIRRATRSHAPNPRARSTAPVRERRRRRRARTGPHDAPTHRAEQWPEATGRAERQRSPSDRSRRGGPGCSGPVWCRGRPFGDGGPGRARGSHTDSLGARERLRGDHDRETTASAVGDHAMRASGGARPGGRPRTAFEEVPTDRRTCTVRREHAAPTMAAASTATPNPRARFNGCAWSGRGAWRGASVVVTDPDRGRRGGVRLAVAGEVAVHDQPRERDRDRGRDADPAPGAVADPAPPRRPFMRRRGAGTDGPRAERTPRSAAPTTRCGLDRVLHRPHVDTSRRVRVAEQVTDLGITDEAGRQVEPPAHAAGVGLHRAPTGVGEGEPSSSSALRARAREPTTGSARRSSPDSACR